MSAASRARSASVAATTRSRWSWARVASRASGRTVNRPAMAIATSQSRSARRTALRSVGERERAAWRRRARARSTGAGGRSTCPPPAGRSRSSGPAAAIPGRAGSRRSMPSAATLSPVRPTGRRHEQDRADRPDDAPGAIATVSQRRSTSRCARPAPRARGIIATTVSRPARIDEAGEPWPQRLDEQRRRRGDGAAGTAIGRERLARRVRCRATRPRRAGSRGPGAGPGSPRSGRVARVEDAPAAVRIRRPIPSSPGVASSRSDRRGRTRAGGGPRPTSVTAVGLPVRRGSRLGVACRLIGEGLRVADTPATG